MTELSLLPAAGKPPARRVISAVGEIETGVAMPERAQPRRYPWPVMDVGDSFHVASAEPVVEFNRVRTAAAAASKKYGKEFIARRVLANDPKGQGVRVWRKS